jgi:hypothetical protein
MSQQNCYAPFDVVPTLAVPEASQANALPAWSNRPSGQWVCQASVGLILKLEGMSRVGLDPRQRLLLRRLLGDPLRAILRGLSGRVADWRRGGEVQGVHLSVVERLACAFFRNLKQARLQLTLDPSRPDAELARTLAWAMRQQFGLLGRQIESAIAARPEPPCGTWLELHGCFACFRERIHPILDGADAARYTDDCQAEAAYKRLLLLGFVAADNAALVPEPGFGSRLRTWVAETRLVAARSMAGGSDLWMVDVAADEPGRWTRELIAEGAGGWVLIPSEEVGDYLQALTPMPFPARGPGGTGPRAVRYPDAASC